MALYMLSVIFIYSIFFHVTDLDVLGNGLERITVAMAGEELIDAIKRREERLSRAENLTMKFLEV